ncbi:hypothetical protein [Streptomyces sp. NPDC058955]|uniref:hypothetical protein n=1 Tax=unclassified Streptomyces TaxID=2593676 RepID=UPI0036665278
MRIRFTRASIVQAVASLCVLSVISCSSHVDEESETDSAAVARRAEQVAGAWEKSPAAASWRAGYHPMGEVVQSPAGGLRSKADQQAFRDHSFVLRGTLPSASPKAAKVAWADGGTLARPVIRSLDSYKSLSGDRVGDEPHLTVTAARLGTMAVFTSRGAATVPAWLFTLDGYATPLKQAAVLPSTLPEPPIGPAGDVPLHPFNGLVGTSKDGRSITVIALHGACDKGPLVQARESDLTVVLSSLARRETGGNCTKQAELQEVTVELDRPLGDRILLDARSGQPIPFTPSNGPTPSWS